MPTLLHGSIMGRETNKKKQRIDSRNLAAIPNLSAPTPTPANFISLQDRIMLFYTSLTAGVYFRFLLGLGTEPVRTASSTSTGSILILVNRPASTPVHSHIDEGPNIRLKNQRKPIASGCLLRGRRGREEGVG